MRRLAIAIAAFAFAAPALAAGSALQAVPANAAAGKYVTQGASWTCDDAGCHAKSDGGSRPAILCERLVKEVGAVASFAADGKAFDEKQLERCNAKAK